MRQYDALATHFDEIASFSHAISLLGWDWSVMMPSGGAEARSTTQAHLKTYLHRLKTQPDLLERIDKAASEDLNEMERANLNLMRDSAVSARAIPEELVQALSKQSSKAEHAWRSLRKENNWRDFAPLLGDVIRLTRDKAEALATATNRTPYNALLHQYEPGLSCADIDPIFDDLSGFLPTFIDAALDKQKARKPQLPEGPFAQAKQETMGREIMRQMGFNFDHGRLDTSTHPFCGGVAADTRMTTRYNDDEWFLALLGIIHETGHGLYQQNLPMPWQRQPAGQARGMAVHESQSLLFEMQVARGRAFNQYLAPIARKTFGIEANQPAWQPENLYHIASKVERGFIRVDADECTYPCHVMLRYGIEKDFIAGKLDVHDLPERWDADMQRLLGISTLGNDKNGCMQDIHWPYGMMGYFPTYTLGALMAAQLMAAVRTQHPDIDTHIANGNLVPITDFMRQHIWQHGSRHSMQELVKMATGKPLDATAFKHHLQQRYIEEMV